MSRELPNSSQPLNEGGNPTVPYYAWFSELNRRLKSIFPDAPSDGIIYGRQNATWVQVPAAPPPTPGTQPAEPVSSVQFNAGGGAFGGSVNLLWDSASNALTLGAASTLRGRFDGTAQMSYVQTSSATLGRTVFTIAPAFIDGTGFGAARADVTLISRQPSDLANCAYQQLAINNIAAQHLFGKLSASSADEADALLWCYFGGAGNVTAYGAVHKTGNWWLGSQSVGAGLPPDNGYKLDVNGALNVTGTIRLSGNSGTAGQVLTSNGGSPPTWSAAGGVSDGDKGDITVASSGTVWTIDLGAVSYNKIQNVSGNSVLARANAAGGSVGEVSIGASQLLGRGSTGDIAAITLGSGLSMSGTTLSSTGGGGTPGGSNTQVQWNNFSAFGGITNVTTNGTNLTALGLDGNLTIVGAARRILGDFSAAAVADRVAVQTSTVNGNTTFNVIPNGTGNQSSFSLYASSTFVGGTALMQAAIVPGTAALWDSLTVGGTGTSEPHRWRTRNAGTLVNGMSLFPDGNLNVGPTTTNPNVRLNVEGSVTLAGTGNRVSADFSNATLTNRTLFQSSTVNGATNVGFLPNGTSTVAGVQLYSSSSLTAGQPMMQAAIAPGSGALWDSITIGGTGTSEAHRFRGTNAGSNVTIASFWPNGNVRFGSTFTDPGFPFQVDGEAVFASTNPIRTGSATLIRSTVAFTNGAGAGAGTLTNAPAAGNPTKWIPINDNGTTRHIPAW